MATTRNHQPNCTCFYCTHCVASHFGGYGDCIELSQHSGPHSDAFWHTWTDADNDRILASRLAFRNAARSH